MKALYLFLLLATAASCHIPRRGDPASDPAAAVRATERQLAREHAALVRSRAATAPGKVDCTRPRAARDNVCTLGKRVCLLVNDGAIPDGPARCKRASLQCRQASDQVNATCPGS